MQVIRMLCLRRLATLTLGWTIPQENCNMPSLYRVTLIGTLQMHIEAFLLLSLVWGVYKMLLNSLILSPVAFHHLQTRWLQQANSLLAMGFELPAIMDSGAQQRSPGNLICSDTRKRCISLESNVFTANTMFQEYRDYKIT